RGTPLFLRAKELSGPIIPHPAHRSLVSGIGRSPHQEPAVRIDHFRVDAIASEVAHTGFEVRSPALGALEVFALQSEVANAERTCSFYHQSLVAFGVDFNFRQAVTEFRFDAPLPQVGRFEDVAVSRDNEVLFLRRGHCRLVSSFHGESPQRVYLSCRETLGLGSSRELLGQLLWTVEP